MLFTRLLKHLTHSNKVTNQDQFGVPRAKFG